MRIEPLEENQMSWMLRPLTWMMKRRVGTLFTPFKAWAYRPGITLWMSIFHSRKLSCDPLQLGIALDLTLG